MDSLVIAFDVEGNTKKCQILRHEGEVLRQAERCAPGALWRRALEGTRRARSQAGRLLCASLLGVALPPLAMAQDDGLIPGLSGWADAVSARTNLKWVGQRVAAPLANPPPASSAWLASADWPLRVHLTRAPSALEWQRAARVLASAEHTLALGQATGLFALADGLDLYLVDSPATGASADARSVSGELDSVHAFASVDVRTPARDLPACVAEALLDALLLELDPAESPSLRRASAAYFAWLIHGESCTPEAPPPELSFDWQRVLERPGALALWLRALGGARDHNRGVFLQEMWQFARQRTWEGSGLRGSPDVLEASAKALELGHERLEEQAAALAARSALAAREGEGPPREAPIRFSSLPAHLPPSAPLDALDASLRLIDLEQPRPGERITIWSRGESGVRWALGATRLRADGSVIAQHAAAVLKLPDAELQLELDAETRFVLIAVVNMAQGLPDADAPPGSWARSVRLIVDRAR